MSRQPGYIHLKDDSHCKRPGDCAYPGCDCDGEKICTVCGEAIDGSGTCECNCEDGFDDGEPDL